MASPQDILDLTARFRQVVAAVDASTVRPAPNTARPLSSADLERAQFVLDCVLDQLFGTDAGGACAVRAVLIDRDNLPAAMRAAAEVHTQVAFVVHAAVEQHRVARASIVSRLRDLGAGG